jgi:Holliday junction resolvasome RuvABC endonuclease subunit
MYLGIDQSLTSTGITIYDGIDFVYKLLKTEKTKGTKCPTIDYTRRLLSLKSQINEVLNENNITYAAMEGMSYGSRGSTIFDLGGLSHIIRELLISKEIDFIIVPPKTLKKYWTGSGNANKSDMIKVAEDEDYNINILKNYATKKNPDIRPDDNIVDSLALCRFLDDYKSGLLNNYEDIIERSWDI